MTLTTEHKIWLTVLVLAMLTSGIYGYEQHMSQREDDAAALASYCARAGALPMLCNGSVKP